MEHPTAEKRKATDEQNSYEKTLPESGSDRWSFPTTKRKALDLKDIGAKVSISQSLYGHIVEFFISLGADNELPSDKAKRISYVNEFHDKVAVNNPLWPENLPFGYVYGAFVNAVIYNRTELKGHNIHAFVTAFKNWITQSGVEDNLRQAYYQNNPEEAPKQLADPNTDKENPETEKLKAEGYVNFPPETVKSQIETLEMMWGTFEEVIKAFPGAKSYAARLYNTRQKYIDEGRWPED